MSKNFSLFLNFRQAISPFPTVFSTLLENFPPFLSNLKLSSANSFSFWSSLKFVIWEWVECICSAFIEQFIASSNIILNHNNVTISSWYVPVVSLSILRRKRNAGYITMQHNYFIAWPRIIKIGQIDVSFAFTRTKMKRWVTKIVFKGVMWYYIISFNPLPDDKILDWAKLKELADDISKCI